MKKPRQLCAFCERKPVPRACAKYCSRSCSDAAHAELQLYPQEAIDANRRTAWQRIGNIIRNDLAQHQDHDGRVPLSVAVRAAIKYRRVGYARGYAARYQRERRGGNDQCV